MYITVSAAVISLLISVSNAASSSISYYKSGSDWTDLCATVSYNNNLFKQYRVNHKAQ